MSYFRTQPGVPTTTMVVFGEWLPDDDRNIEPGRNIFWLNGAPVPLQDAKNVIYTGASYRPFGTPVAQGTALPVVPVDAFTAYYSGNAWLIAGSGAALYYSKDGGATWTACGSGFTGSGWVFAQYGNCVYATNGVNPIQTMDLSATTPAFAALNAATAPVAFAIGVIRDFVVAGNIVSGDQVGAWVVQWSALANPSVWELPNTQAARADQSGAQSLYSQYGAVQFIAQGEENAIIFQETGITRVQYVGGDVVFGFYTFERKRGLLTPRAAAQAGNTVYFLSADGFYATQGTEVEPIGYGKVNRYFLADCTDLTKVRAAIDTLNQVVVWSYPNASGTAQLCYNFAEKRWTRGAYTVGTLYQGMSGTQYQPQMFNVSNGVASAAQFATGNGSTSTYTLNVNGTPLTSTTVTAIHQTDWQGRRALSNVARTNQASYSNNPSQPWSGGSSANGWNLGGSVTAAPSGAAPDGGTAYSLTPTTANATHFATPTLFAGTSGPQSATWILKANGYVYVKLVVGASSWNFNLSTGAQTAQSGSGSASSLALANGWWAISVSGTGSGGFNGSTHIELLNASQVGTFAGDGASGILFGGVLVENAASAGVQIPTTSAPVTVTDYTQTGNQINFGQVPALNATEDWDGTYTDWNVNAFSGAVTDCELTTKDFRFDPSAHALVTSIRIMSDDNATGGVAARDQDTDAQNFVGYLTPETISRAVSVRADGFMHAVNVKMTAGFTYCQGVGVDYVLRGSR